MDLKERAILDELSSAEEPKVTSALQLLLQLATQGRDISCYAEQLFNALKSPSKINKILSLQLWHHCHVYDRTYQEVLNVLITELKSDQSDVSIESFKLLAHIPSRIVAESIEDGKFELDCFFMGDNSPQVRRAVVECLTILIFQKRHTSSIKTFVEFGLQIIVDRLIDPNSVVVHEAYNSIHTLFLELRDPFNTRLCLNRDDPGSGPLVANDGKEHYGRSQMIWRGDSKVQSLEHIFQFVCSHIYKKFARVLERFSALEPHLRWPGVLPLVNIARRIFDSKSQTPIPDSNLSHAMVHEIVQEHLLPLLSGTDITLALEVAREILPLSIIDNQLQWTHAAVFSLSALLSHEEISDSVVQAVITEILSVCPYLTKTLEQTILKVIQATQRLQTLEKRVNILLPIFHTLLNFVLDNPADDCLDQLFSDPWLVEVWYNDKKNNYFREEILACMIRASFDLLSKDDQCDAAVSLLNTTISCLSWITPRQSSLELYIQLLNRVCDVQPAKVTSLLYNVHGKLDSMPQSSIKLKMMFLLLKFTPTDEFHREFMQKIKAGFLYTLVGRERASSTLQPNEGRLGVIRLPVIFTHQASLPDILLCLQMIGISSTKSDMVQDVKMCLMAISNFFKTTDIGISRLAHDISLQIESLKTSPETFQSTLFDSFPISQITSEESDEAESFRYALFIATKKAQAGLLNSFSYSANNMAQQRQSLIPIQISSINDPLMIETYHLMNSALKRITVLFRIRNCSSVPLQNIQLVVSTSGALVHTSRYPAQVEKVIAELKYKRSVDWRVSFQITEFAINGVHLQVNFLSALPEVRPVPQIPAAPSSGLPVDQRNVRLKQMIAVGSIARTFDSSVLSTCVANPDWEEELAPDNRFKSFSLLCNDYVIRSCELLHPISLTREEFFWLWNRSPAVFHRTARATSTIPLEKLLDMLANAQGFKSVYQFSYGDNRFFQMASSALTWFNDHVLFQVVGSRVSGALWECRFEFRCSSAPVLLTFEQYVERWVESTSNHTMQLIYN